MPLGPNLFRIIFTLAEKSLENLKNLKLKKCRASPKHLAKKLVEFYNLENHQFAAPDPGVMLMVTAQYPAPMHLGIKVLGRKNRPPL